MSDRHFDGTITYRLMQPEEAAVATVFQLMKDASSLMDNKDLFITHSKEAIALYMHNGVTVIAFAGDQPVGYEIVLNPGYISIYEEYGINLSSNNLCIAKSIGVNEALRGRGVAAEMHGLCELKMVAKGAQSFLATVSPDNVASRSFLDSMGYTVFGKPILYKGRKRLVYIKGI